MKLYVAAVLLLFVSLGSAAGLDKCAWGESYWCSELEVAKTCGAFKHCMSTVWKNQKLAQDASEVCEFCEAIVDDVRKFLTDNRTEADVAKFLVSACGVIPSETTAATCKLLVQQYLPEIIQLLAANMSPQVVCSLMKLCNGLEDKVTHHDVHSRQVLHHVPLMKDVPAVVGDTDYCTDCKKFFTDFKEMMTDKTQQEVIEQFLEHDVCVWFGFMEKKCKEMVVAFLPLYLEYISQFDDPNMICHLIRFCTEDLQLPVPKNNIFQLLLKAKSASADSNDECATCKQIVGELQTEIRDPDVQKWIIEILKTEVCPRLGQSNATCIAVVDAYAKMAFQFIAAWMDPDARCRGFGFCPKAPLTASSSFNGVVHLETALKAHEVKDQNECAICELIVNALKSLIAKNSTEEEILEGLDKVCSLLPSPMDGKCKAFVDEYVPAIITLLRQEVDAAQVCSLLGLCSSQKPVTLVKSGETCIVCETIVQYIEAMLDDKTSVEDIEKLMQKVCNFLPETMKAQCVNIVDTYGALIIHLIATEYTPEQVCKIAKLCSSEANALPALLGSNKCTEGPAYWCISPLHAQQCGAAEHCKKFVWKN